MKFNYSIYRPSGNDTALVYGLVKDNSLKKKINDAIQHKHSNVEQVGFVEKVDNEYYLEMAGGEFCGNATRSTIHYFLQGKSGNLAVNASGAKNKLNGGIMPDGKVWVEMPINHDLNKIFVKDGYTVVEMEGISHVIAENNQSDSSEALKSKALAILKSLGLDISVPASGVMFTTKTQNGFKIDPVVWVKNLETLYYETACGSGTTALGLYESKKQNKSLSIDITQPSGMDITIKIDKSENAFLNASIFGNVELLEENLEIEV